MARSDANALYDRWLTMWNGNLALANEIVAPGCVVHQAPFGAGEPPVFRGPDGVAKMVEMGRTPFADLTFTPEIGPIADGAFVCGRWLGQGAYRGGIPGATTPEGTPIAFRGIDILRVEDGKVVEYWVSSDGAHLMAQLGIS